MTSVCKTHPLDEETRRRARPYAILLLATYFGAVAITTGVIIWACVGLPINVRLLGLLVALPVLIRHFGMLFVGRRIAAITGEPPPQVSMIGHVINVVGAAFLILLPWL